jgi:uncharacterized surface protein with fasciclin (FAS1) repeats
MRDNGLALLVCLLLGVVQGGLGSRTLQQFDNELGSSNAASPDTEDYGGYDSGSGTTVCYSPLDVLFLLNSTYNLTYFETALLYTGIADLLNNPLEGLTLLAPTDQAFLDAADQLGVDIDQLLNSPVLIPVLLNHIIGLPLLSGQLSNGEVLPTALGQFLNVSVSNDTLEFSSLATSAEVVDGDNCNCDLCTSVVDVIDAVLLPDILNITSNGPETTILIRSQSGSEQVFVVLNESGTLGGAAPKGAPAMGFTKGKTTSQSASGLALAPVASSTIRKKGTSTSTGMTYFTNTAANS